MSILFDPGFLLLLFGAVAFISHMIKIKPKP